jgi:signal peptide peptidase SppA
MKYAHILMAVYEERWALQESKLQAILDFLSRQAAGEKFSAEELAARIPQKTEREVARKVGRVALIPVRGVIANRMSMMGDISGGTSNEALASAFQAAVRDEDVKAIVLDVDSPGGAVSGTDELSAMIFAARGVKPIVAHVNATAASAAYWSITGADEVVVTPSGSVGSIGVFGVHDDVSQALEKVGVKKTLISAGKFKTAGNPFAPLDDDTRARMQARVDASYERFVATVARNRRVAVSKVRSGFGQGEMVDAEAAVAEGMADSVATLDETLQRFGVSLYGGTTQAPPSTRRASAIQRERRALQL